MSDDHYKFMETLDNDCKRLEEENRNMKLALNYIHQVAAGMPAPSIQIQEAIKEITDTVKQVKAKLKK